MWKKQDGFGNELIEERWVPRNRSNYRHSLEKKLRFASVDKEALHRRRERIKEKNEAKQ